MNVEVEGFSQLDPRTAAEANQKDRIFVLVEKLTLAREAFIHVPHFCHTLRLLALAEP